MNIEKLAFKNYYELINIQKIDLLLIIEFLQKDRKQWINQFTQTHNESVEIQKENKQLSREVDVWNKKYNDMFDENKQLKDNWNKLKSWADYMHTNTLQQNNYGRILDKMQEIERGVGNVKD